MSRTSRRGKTLIEVMVLITLTTVVMASSATTLIALFRVERQLAQDGETRQGLSRLASRVRADAHAAIGCQAGDECTLTLPGGEALRYAVRDGRLWRERLVGDEVQHRDSFPLAAGSTARFEVEPLGKKQALRLSIAPARQEQPAIKPQPQPTVITAVIDLHGTRAQEEGS
jgi:hypothetical protein